MASTICLTRKCRADEYAVAVAVSEGNKPRAGDLSCSDVPPNDALVGGPSASRIEHRRGGEVLEGDRLPGR